MNVLNVSSHIRNLVPYSPGKPISETKRELGLETVVKLASNENPLGPSPKALKAIQAALQEIHLYPDAAAYELGQAFAERYGVPRECLVFGNGSNELIDLLVRVFCEPNKEAILTSDAAFVAYPICAQAARVEVKTTPLTQDLKFDLQAMAAQLRQPELAQRVRLVFIANPNNPTGTYVNQGELEAFLAEFGNREDLLVVLDEAYVEFVRALDYPSGLELMKQYPGLVLLRTLSKVYGLAGLRVGALVARPELADLLHRVRNPFNVNSLAQAAAAAALSDQDYLKRVQELTWSGLDYFYKELEALGLKYWPSQGNFVLFDSLRDSSALFQSWLKRGVISRPVKNYGLATHIRLSVGLREENELAMSTLAEVLKEVPPSTQSAGDDK